MANDYKLTVLETAAFRQIMHKINSQEDLGTAKAITHPADQLPPVVRAMLMESGYILTEKDPKNVYIIWR